MLRVAPARERGLKSEFVGSSLKPGSRSRKGAWIEIRPRLLRRCEAIGRSRKGAWIEIFHGVYSLNKYQGRSRKGAWIEI